jgi:hypothetical protein
VGVAEDKVREYARRIVTEEVTCADLQGGVVGVVADRVWDAGEILLCADSAVSSGDVRCDQREHALAPHLSE